MKIITIGRGQENDIVINDLKISRHHLQIIQDDYGNFRLADFGSTNGTFVNGRQVKGEVHLNVNDVIRIGNTTLPWRSYFSTYNDHYRVSEDEYNIANMSNEYLDKMEQELDDDIEEQMKIIKKANNWQIVVGILLVISVIITVVSIIAGN
ncbi:MAG: FHA domain-containing protein [Prevotellaceae bacterium]|jgi:pSer/pThr/pTyr-binding forkhead associated (FHA) protein|nr:FHA domain-containing protein [Prevotellaceae bacterium]